MLYRAEPRDFKAQFSAVACEVRCDDTILLLRCAMPKEFAGFLGLPGGKKERTETPYEAMARELFEETGIDKRSALGEFRYIGVRWVRFRNNLDFMYQHFRLELSQQPRIMLSPREHLESLWVQKPYIREYASQMIEDVFETLQDVTWQ